MRTVKPRDTETKPANKPELKFGLPGSAEERKARIKRATEANRETLRRLAK
jgi:hypothetical protein